MKRSELKELIRECINESDEFFDPWGAQDNAHVRRACLELIAMYKDDLRKAQRDGSDASFIKMLKDDMEDFKKVSTFRKPQDIVKALHKMDSLPRDALLNMISTVDEETGEKIEELM